MNVVIDSYGLLGAIGRNREAFSAIGALVKKQAAALLTAQLKHKSLDLALYRAIVSVIGSETFELFFDTPDDRLLKTIAKKLDPHATVTKMGDGDALRTHLINLAARKIEPTAKPSKVWSGAKKKAAAKSEPAAVGEPHAIATKPPGRR